MSELKPFAFVLMPFDEKFKDIYKFGIKAVANEIGVVAERVDEQHFSETILERVYRQIEHADFIIAEMTGKNPNVFYEVGYAHAKNKMCALVTQNAHDIPFDLKHHSHVIYDGTASDLASKLTPKIEWFASEAKRRKTETISVSAKASDGLLDKETYYHFGTFDLSLELKNNSDNRSPEIDSLYIRTQPLWTLYLDEKECPAIEIDEDGKKRRNHQITPSVRRLLPNAFMKLKIKFKRRLWSKFSGEPEQEDYHSKGVVRLDIATSEGTITKDFTIEVKFDDIPF